MDWLWRIFGRGGRGSHEPPAEEPVSAHDAKLEAGAHVLIEHLCAMESCEQLLRDRGLTTDEIWRLHALVPVACGRRLFAGSKPGPKYAQFYVDIDGSGQRTEVPYWSCPFYAAIGRAIDRSSSHAKVAWLGAMCGETRAINDTLNRMKDQGMHEDLGKIVVYPTEISPSE